MPQPTPSFHPSETLAIPHWTSRHEQTRLDMYGRGRAPLFTQQERRSRLVKGVMLWLAVLLFSAVCWYLLGLTVAHLLHAFITFVKGGR